MIATKTCKLLRWSTAYWPLFNNTYNSANVGAADLFPVDKSRMGLVKIFYHFRKTFYKLELYNTTF